MTYRDDLVALTARHDALTGEVAEKTRELDASRKLLEQAQARARLPVLDNIRVATPCTADWNQMTGDERTRHCGQCRKNVYNLSGMTRDEAEALIVERNGDLCVRYYQRADGTILLADCSVGRASRSRHRWIAAGAAAVVSAGLGAAVAMNHFGGGAEQLGKMHAVVGELPLQPPPELQLQPPPQPPQQVHEPEELQVIMGGMAMPVEQPPVTTKQGKLLKK
jgi:hypothetical protein